MGIRYYAYPVRAELVEHARADPQMFISDDPLMDAWGDEDGRPRMLYLDKAWRVMQRLLADRPSRSMVTGDVRWTDQGGVPWFSVLDPDDVAEVARDVLLVEPVEADSDLLEPGNWDAETINHYLEDIRRFVSELAAEESGLVYVIG